MRVYAETNFVLELAIEQEQHASCEAIQQLAKAHDIQLVLPVYSVGVYRARVARAVPVPGRPGYSSSAAAVGCASAANRARS